MPYLVAMDISVLGTARIYRKHQTGVHRVLDELLQQFYLQTDSRMEFLSVGRAPWLEFATHITFDQHYRRKGWVFRPRKPRIPGSYSFLLMLGRAALFARGKNWISENVLAGFFQILGWGLQRDVARFESKTYYSPAHAFPALPADIKRCITLYDMIPVKFPQWYHESESFRNILRSIDGNRDLVITISRSSRQDWLDYSRARPDLARVIPLGVPTSFFPREDRAGLQRIREKYGVGEGRFILSVGTLEPRKNLETLVPAFLELRKNEIFRDLSLLLVGPKGWKNGPLFDLLRSHSEPGNTVRLAGFVPDEDLPWLYSAAELFVFPSLYEGFGLPVAEALKCGAAVLCGDNSSLPEVASDAAEYAEVGSVDALQHAMEKLLSDPERLKSLREKAQRHCRDRFEWSDCGEAYRALFSSLAN